MKDTNLIISYIWMVGIVAADNVFSLLACLGLSLWFGYCYWIKEGNL